jgi:putative phosphoserine phosphatase/1-acylglycerol-3-phosphate O-acyltransferase
VIDGSWRQAVNLVVSMWGELGTALAGIDLRVTGEENLWSRRPAVFIFNHQSGVDMLLLCKMLRRDIVGIAKQEARRNPIFGPVMAIAGTVFIDRFNHERALEALKPALDALREGYSLVIAPEGTRSPTPRIGRFKKGAFRMAMAAGVPIVPIVFRNTLDALPKHGFIVRPAVVEATVLPPIPTSDWTVETLDEEIDRVRNLYVRTLEG